MTDQIYVPPKVWQADEENGGEWSGINRPTAGARHEQALPKGEHSLQLHSLGTPNGQKVTIMLEELLELGATEAEYDAWPINIGKGDQFGSEFVAINPNSKIPALLDYSTTEPVRVFESGAICLYLAEKFGHFLPSDHRARTEVLNWLFWLQGAAPYLGGGFGHFFAYAPQKFKYPIDRFSMETKRMLDVLDKQLADHEYIAGELYSIADIVIFPWFGNLVLGKSYKDSAEFLNVDSYSHVKRWAQNMAKRPAVKRGSIVNGFGDGGLLERHSSADFDGLID